MSEELTDLKSALDRKSASDLFSNEETSEELRNHPGKYRDRKSSGETSDNDNESTSRVEFDPLKNIVRAPSPLLALLKDKLLKRPILDQVGATSATATLLEHCGLATVDEAEVEVEESSFEEHEKKRVRSDSSHSSTMSTNKRQKSSDNEADRDDDDDSSEDESETEVQSKRKKAKTTGLSGVEPSTSHLTREDEFVLKVPSVTVGLVNQTPAKRKSGSLTPIGSQRAGLTPIGLDTVRGVSSGSKNAAIGSSAVISNQFDAQQKVLELQKDSSIMQGEITDQFAESLFKFQCKEAYPKPKESMRLEDYFVATRLWYELLTGCFLEPEAGQRKELSAELISGINNCEFIKKTGETPWQYFSRVNHKTVGGEEVVYLPTLHPIANSDVIPNTAFLQLVSFIYPHFSKLKVEYKNKVHNILREIADDTEAVEMMPILEYAKNEDNERQLLGLYSVDDVSSTISSMGICFSFSHFKFAFLVVGNPSLSDENPKKSKNGVVSQPLAFWYPSGHHT